MSATEGTTKAKPQSRAHHFQRGEGSCPSGNNRIRKVPISPIPGTHNHDDSARRSPRRPFHTSTDTPVTTTSIQTKPMARRIHPMVLRGCCDVMSAPTIGKRNIVATKRSNRSPLRRP